MKTIIKIIVLLIVNSIYSQNTNGQYRVNRYASLYFQGDQQYYGELGVYARDTENEREQYLGLWRYETATILFEVKIEKADKLMFMIQDSQDVVSNYCFFDSVIFKYKLVENGITIYDNLNKVMPNSVSKNNYLSSGRKQGWYDYLSGRFIDYTRNVAALVEIKKLNTVPEKISFDMSRNIYNKLNTPSFYTDTSINLFNVPVGLIEMVKVY